MPLTATERQTQSDASATLILGVESSCDETAAAILCAERGLLSNIVASQDADHTPYGGVVPEIAARAHMSKIDRIIDLTKERSHDETGRKK